MNWPFKKKAKDSALPFQPNERALRSRRWLEARRVHVIPHLPNLDEEDFQWRSAEEAAERACTLTLLFMAAMPNVEISSRDVMPLIQGEGLKLTGHEAAFLALDAPSEEESLRFGWGCESAWALFWALGLTESMGLPNEHCDLDWFEVVLTHGVGQLVSTAKLRAESELADALDLYYRANWATNQSALDGKRVPALDPGIVFMRRYALEWLADRSCSWDSVDMST